MAVYSALESHSQLAEGSQPGMSSLDYPAVATQSIIAFDAPARDPILDAAHPEMASATRIVVAFVGMQFVGPASRSASPSGDSWQRVHQGFEDHRVVSIRPRHAEHQRDALPVRDDVPLAAELAAVCRVGARVRAPRGLGTDDPSILARLRSSWPALRSFSSKTMWRRCHTPAACQSRSLRQQVMPLPKPSSWGRSSHAIPVRSTKRMPLSANSSSNRGRPPAGDGLTFGNSGSICFQSAALTSLLFPMTVQRSSLHGR